jgi:hypothetical protein
VAEQTPTAPPEEEATTGLGAEPPAAPTTAADTASRWRPEWAGMQERARLLSGVCLILSRPGGPTTIAVHIPAWRPAG